MKKDSRTDSIFKQPKQDFIVIARSEATSQRRPCERRDPYAAILRLGTVANAFFSNRLR